MNLLTNNNRYPVDPCSKGHFDPCSKGHRDTEIALRFSQPRNISLTALAANAALTLTTLNLYAGHLCDSTIKLDFASNLILPLTGTATAISLSFQVYRLSDGLVGKVPVGPAWTFTGATLTTAAQASIISFFVFDTDIDLGHHVYSVEVTNTGTAALPTGLSANNSTLSALISGEPAGRR